MGLKRIIGFWFIAGLIVTLLSLLWAYFTGGLVGAFSEATITAAFAELFFPFDLIVGWSLNVVAIIMQIVFFVSLTLFSFKRSGLQSE
jgi:hypothetical protein